MDNAIDAGLAEQALHCTLGSGIDMETRTIYLVGEINEEMLYRFIVGFQTLDQTPGTINVILVSPGGSEPVGFAIYDLIKLAYNPVQIDCYGLCMSIAALVLQAAGYRRLSPECRFMIHNGHVDLNTGVDAKTLVSLGQEVDRNSARYHALLAERSGLETERVAALCQKETYLSAEEAIGAGFADGVVKPTSKPAKRKTRALTVIDASTIEKVIRRVKQGKVRR